MKKNSSTSNMKEQLNKGEDRVSSRFTSWMENGTQKKYKVLVDVTADFDFMQFMQKR